MQLLHYNRPAGSSRLPHNLAKPEDGSVPDQWELEASAGLMRQLAQALHHRVDELEALFDMLPIGLAIADDPACQYIRANATLARLLDVPAAANVSLNAPPEERPSYRVL